MIIVSYTCDISFGWNKVIVVKYTIICWVNLFNRVLQSSYVLDVFATENFNVQEKSMKIEKIPFTHTKRDVVNLIAPRTRSRFVHSYPCQVSAKTPIGHAFGMLHGRNANRFRFGGVLFPANYTEKNIICNGQIMNPLEFSDPSFFTPTRGLRKTITPIFRLPCRV